jgi:hypothetical protein
MAGLSIGAKFVCEARGFLKPTAAARLAESEETERYWFDREFEILSGGQNGKGTGSALDRPVDAEHVA